MNDNGSLDGMTPEGQIAYWKDKAQRAEAKLQDHEDVRKAKLLLMAEGWTEPDAHRYIQKTAMDQRRPAGALARDLIAGLPRPPRTETAAHNG